MRQYAADLGRFLSRDQVGYSEGVNIYEYVGGNPLCFVDPLGLARKSVSLSFSQDFTTCAAAWYQWANSDIALTADPRNVDWAALQAQLESQLCEDDSIDSASIAGHGGFGAAVTTGDLRNSASGANQFFKYLGSRMSPNNGGITLRACSMGGNQPFMDAMSAVAPSRVIGWNDWYAIVPHGKEFTSFPDGTYRETGDTFRRWDGSWLQWLPGGGRKPKPGDGKVSKYDGKKGKGGKECGFKCNPKGTKGLKDGMDK